MSKQKGQTEGDRLVGIYDLTQAIKRAPKFPMIPRQKGISETFAETEEAAAAMRAIEGLDEEGLARLGLFRDPKRDMKPGPAPQHILDALTDPARDEVRQNKAQMMEALLSPLYLSDPVGLGLDLAGKGAAQFGDAAQAGVVSVGAAQGLAGLLLLLRPTKGLKAGASKVLGLTDQLVEVERILKTPGVKKALTKLSQAEGVAVKTNDDIAAAIERVLQGTSGPEGKQLIEKLEKAGLDNFSQFYDQAQGANLIKKHSSPLTLPKKQPAAAAATPPPAAPAAAPPTTPAATPTPAAPTPAAAPPIPPPKGSKLGTAAKIAGGGIVAGATSALFTGGKQPSPEASALMPGAGPQPTSQPTQPAMNASGGPVTYQDQLKKLEDMTRMLDEEPGNWDDIAEIYARAALYQAASLSPDDEIVRPLAHELMLIKAEREKALQKVAQEEQAAAVAGLPIFQQMKSYQDALWNGMPAVKIPFGRGLPTSLEVQALAATEGNR